MTPNEINWKKIKKIYWESYPLGQEYIDEINEILVIRDETNEVSIVGYVHCKESNVDLSMGWLIGDEMLDFFKEINELGASEWVGHNTIIITDFEIVILGQITLKKFPKSYKYLYLKKDIELSSPFFIEQDLMHSINISYPENKLLPSSKQLKTEHRYWSCDICDGDTETGCLWFDLTECPKHT